MHSTATTVREYLAALPANRRDAIARVRDVINASLPGGYEETMQFGMISWCVPESVLPARDVYNKQPLSIACLASQKNHMAVYMLGVYGDAKERARFEAAYKRTGKKLDMGKSCLRFPSLDALPLDVLGDAMSRIGVDQYVAAYKRIRTAMMKPAAKAARTAARKAAAKRHAATKNGATKPAARKPAARKPAARKPAARKPAANKRR